MKRTILRGGLALLAGFILLLLVGPFLIPVPPLEDTQTPQALADPDSQFIEINGLDVHLKIIGQGEPYFVLLHGFSSSLYTWSAVMKSFNQIGTVIAFDRPAFGLTERPLIWEGRNPYSPEAQMRLVVGVLDYFGAEEAVLVGNSAGGTVAMATTLAYPQRVSALILVDPAVYTGGGAPAWVQPLLRTPQMRRLGPLVARQLQSRGAELIDLAWHDPGQIRPETLQLYQKPFRVQNWDIALWEFTLASSNPNLEARLDEFNLPVLVITGDDDRIVPTAESIRLADELPNARLIVIQQAGHVPHEERPAAFMDAVNGFVSEINF